MPRREKRSGNCGLCKIYRISLHGDHIVPRWKGGSEEAENIQWICSNCHEDKTREDLKGIPGSNKGRVFSDESRDRMSKAAASSQKRGGHTLGYRWTEAQKQAHSIRLREAFQRKPRQMPPASEERKRKVSESLLLYHEQKRRERDAA